MKGSDIEDGLRRGVLFWWLFCFLSASTFFTGLRPSFTVIPSIFILPVVFSRVMGSSQPVSRNPANKRNDLLISAIASGHGCIQFAVTALIRPSWSPLSKAIITTIMLHIAILVAKRQKDSEAAFRSLHKLNQIPVYLGARLEAARQLQSRFVRLPAIFLGYLALYTFVSLTMFWAVNFDLPHSELPRLRLLLRRQHLRAKSRLTHALGRDQGPFYKHTPILDDLENPRKIRLLKLLKRWPLGNICCELIEADLHGGIEYDTISYHWGGGEKSEPIYINSKAYLVSQSVLGVLYHLSSYKRERLVWIDSICINQLDTAEKSSQISLMRDIYRNSSMTIVWLDGVEDPWKVRTMLSGIWHEHMFGTTESCLALLRRYSETWAEAGWAQLMNMFAIPYFFRVWVIQEVVMASSVTILASGEPLDWDHITTLAEMLTSLPYNMVLQSATLPGVIETFPTGLTHAAMMGFFRQHNEGSPQSLPNLLTFCNDFQATEAVDKVYALLGLLSPTDGVHDWMVADCSRTPSEVFTFTAKHTIPLACNEILSYAGIGYNRNVSNLPSWAPDWTSLEMINSYRQYFAKIQHSAKYQASAGMEPEITFPEEPLADQQLMRILGHCFDKIAHVGPVLSYAEHNFGAGPSLDILLDLVTRHMRARRLATTFGRDPYPTGEPIDEVFWRSLIGNTQFERPAPDELGVYCRLWERGLISEFGDDVEELRDETNLMPTMEQMGTLGMREEAMRLGMTWNSSRIMCCTGRALSVTENGYIAMVPPGTAIGDSVCLLYGLNTPFILRQCEKSFTRFRLMQLVGEAYVHGMMDGEAMLANPLEIEHFDVI